MATWRTSAFRYSGTPLVGSAVGAIYDGCHAWLGRVNDHTAIPAVQELTKGALLAGFLRRRQKHERAGFQLYATAVTAARDPYLYETLEVPDTLDGRFDAIVLYVYLIIRRLNTDPEPGPALAQAVFDAMFLDMDINLREMGVGDLSVGKRNRAMWEAFHGRSAAYAAAWDDVAALEAAIARNVWRGAAVPAGSPASMVRLARAQAACLAGQGLPAMLVGDVQFLPANEAAQ